MKADHPHVKISSNCSGTEAFLNDKAYKTERTIMRKLALSDEILLQIEKPARYIGNEVNSVMKEKEKVEIRFAMCFPDVYEIGMSHLGTNKSWKNSFETS